MIVYWALYFIPVAIALAPVNATERLRQNVWIAIAIPYILAIGLRYEVGCDWDPYLFWFNAAYEAPLGQVLQDTDPGYAFLNWTFSGFDNGIFGVNLVCAALFVCGLLAFVKRQPAPWLALAIAVPYLVNVVAMGYTRQSVALGLVFWALATLHESKPFKYMFFITAATLFHKSALLMMPLAIVVSKDMSVRKIIAVVGLMFVLATLLVLQYSQTIWQYYVEAEMESEGASIRVMMNVVPAVLMFALWGRWKRRFSDYPVWLCMAFLAIACVPFVSAASTAVDRVALYFTPLQIAVLSRWPLLFKTSIARPAWKAAILITYGAVMWVWFTFGIHARLCWIPYKTPWF